MNDLNSRTSVASAWRVRQLLTCGLSEIEASIYCTNEKEFYEYYKINGFDKVLKNMERICKLRDTMGSQTKVLWKYILFKWNDSDESLDWLYNKSHELNTTIVFTTTNAPAGCESKKYGQGSEELLNLLKKFNTIEKKSAIQNV